MFKVSKIIECPKVCRTFNSEASVLSANEIYTFLSFVLQIKLHNLTMLPLNPNSFYKEYKNKLGISRTISKTNYKFLYQTNLFKTLTVARKDSDISDDFLVINNWRDVQAELGCLFSKDQHYNLLKLIRTNKDVLSYSFEQFKEWTIDCLFLTIIRDKEQYVEKNKLKLSAVKLIRTNQKHGTDIEVNDTVKNFYKQARSIGKNPLILAKKEEERLADFDRIWLAESFLAKKTGFSQSWVNKILERLTRKGLIKRTFYLETIKISGKKENFINTLSKNEYIYHYKQSSDDSLFVHKSSKIEIGNIVSITSQLKPFTNQIIDSRSKEYAESKYKVSYLPYRK